MNALPLTKVPAGEVAAVWPSLRPQLQALRDRFNERWLPEHVFLECMTESSYLWTTPDLCGFVVLQILATPYARDLHVWIACNETDARAGEFIEQLKAIAAENGCQRVTWESDRTGWSKAHPEIRARYRYSVEVGD